MTERYRPVVRDLAILVGLFAALRVVAVAGISPVRWPDSSTYFDVDLLGRAYRLWTVPVGYRVLPSDTARVAAQLVAAVVGWGGLAVAAARACRHPALARAAALAVLVLGLTVQVTQWDLTILSESTAISLTALGAALGLRLAAPPPARWVLPALLAVVVLWTFTRHSDALALLVLFPVAAGLLLWRAPRRAAALAVVAVLAIMAVWAGYAVSRDNAVWPANAFLIARHRIMPDDQARHYFAARGLPVAAFRAQAGVRDPVAYRDPRIRAWILARWKSAYGSYLLSRPLDTVVTPLRRAPKFASTDGGTLRYAQPRAVLPGFVQDVVWGSGAWLLVLAGFSLLLWLGSLRRGPPRAVELVPWALVVLGLVWCELVWTLSAGELPRLSVPGGVALRAGFVLLAAFAVDRLLSPPPRGEPAAIN